jgi:hypothetical protein
MFPPTYKNRKKPIAETILDKITDKFSEQLAQKAWDDRDLRGMVFGLIMMRNAQDQGRQHSAEYETNLNSLLSKFMGIPIN